DPKNQSTSQEYFVDGLPRTITYDNPEHPTPAVTFSYDPSYRRLTSATSGAENTTYSYYPVTKPPTLGAVRLASTDGPIASDTITYAYDELGRVVMRSVGDATSSRVFDELGRVISVTDPLGPFGYTYDGASSRLSTIAVPNGQISAYSYFDN